ncbi:hypothetical protein K438DRAFT_1968500 [Mycena galopus ATCC 62051]|nr:hypothetical protein K438DRAFT_1968500 [Mycena galopus ATCC 62051]
MSASSTASAQSANARRKARQRMKKSDQGMDDGQEPDQEMDRDVIENPDQPIRNFHDHPSAPPHNLDSNGDQFDANRFSDDHCLEEYTGPQPVQLLDPDVRILKGSLPLPTFQPYCTIIEGDVDIIARHQHALDLGAEGFAKPSLRHPKVATQRMYTSVCHAKLTLIDTTMLLNKENAYRLQKSTYWAFWKLLDDLRKRAKPAFEIFGSLTPTIPPWGRNEDPLIFYAANEFKILGICYRAEVENFLALLHERFDFISDEIRPPDEEAKIFYEDFHRSMSVGMGLGNSENCSFDASPFRIRPVLSPGSAKGPFVKKEEKESKFRNQPENVPSTGGNAAAGRAHWARVEAVTDEDDRETAIPFPRNALSAAPLRNSPLHRLNSMKPLRKVSLRRTRNLTASPSGFAINRLVPRVTMPYLISRSWDLQSPTILLDHLKKKGLVHDSSDEDRDGRYFDLRLKDADIPTWDGDPDKLL